MTLGSIAVYATLIATGYLLYGKAALAAVLVIVALVSGYFILKLWGQMDGPLEESLTLT